MICQIDEWTHIDRRIGRGPSIAAQNLRQIRHNTGVAPQLSELEHQSQSTQFTAETAQYLVFTAPFNDGVEVIRTDNNARNELQNARHHTRVLGRTHGKRHETNEPSVFARRKYREMPSFPKMLPPRRKPLVCQKQTMRSAGFQEGVPLIPELKEFFCGLDSFDNHWFLRLLNPHPA